MRGEGDRTLLPAIGFLVITCAIVVVYYPGLHGPFVFDDIVNIINNPNIAATKFDFASLWDTAFSGHSSIFKRPLPTLSFAFNYLASEKFADTTPFKITNLIIHFVNTFLVWRFINLLLRVNQQHSPSRQSIGLETWLPLAVAAIWALHPLHLTSVLFVVQRMTSLSAMFVLTGLIAFLHGRNLVHERRPNGFRFMVAGWLIGLVLGTACKENALLFPGYILIIEYLFFTEKIRDSGIKRKLLWFYILSSLLPIVLVVGTIIINPDFIIGDYKTRDFTPLQRILTEARVLWFYLGQLLIPDIRDFTLYHDDIEISSNLFTPWSTLPAVLGIVSSAVLAAVYAKKYPILGFAILWYLLGHAMESSIIGLEIAHEHRNYLPDIGPLLGMVYGVSRVFAKNNKSYAALILLLPAGLMLGIVTNQLAQTWSSEASIIEAMVRNHPRSARSHAIMGEFLAHRKGLRLRGVEHYKMAYNLAPQEIGHQILMVIIACEERPDLMREAPFSGCSDDSITNNNSTKNQTPPNPEVGPGTYTGSTSVLDKIVVDRVSYQLASLPPRLSTLVALRALSDCITVPPYRCSNLSAVALRWYISVLHNPHLSPTDYHSIVVYIFDISFWQGDYATAVETAKQARIHDPRDVTYALMEANAFIKLDRLMDAEEILKSLGPALEYQSKEIQGHVNTLYSMINQRRSLK